MNIKTERAVNAAVNKTNATRWEKAKRWGRKALLAAVSTVSIAAGMFGTTQQMQAQNPQVVEVNVNDLNDYLRNSRRSSAQTREQQYAQVYQNRENYYRQQQCEEWVRHAKLSRHLRYEYEGVYVNTRTGQAIFMPRTDEYGVPLAEKLVIDDIQEVRKMQHYRQQNPNGPYGRSRSYDRVYRQTDVNVYDVIDAAHSTYHFIRHITGGRGH